MKHLTITLLALILSTSINGARLDDLIIPKNSEANSVVLNLLKNGQLNERNNRNSSLGKKVCEKGKSSVCSYVRSLGEGICMAGGGSECVSVKTVREGICKAGGKTPSSCYFIQNIGEAICMAGGGSACVTVRNIGQGICKAGRGINCSSVSSIQEGLNKVSTRDRYWFWDKYRDEYGNAQWRCRGSQTGQFTENLKCSGKTKDDDRWPRY
jgi:hypothetical protein